jgi:beta propeller repeat protein
MREHHGQLFCRYQQYWFLLLLVLAVCCSAATAAGPSAGTGTFGISNHSAILWRSAQIDGDRIVWAEHSSHAGFIYNIYLYNITTGTETLIAPVAPDEPHNDYSGDEHPVAISGSRIVWSRYGNIWLSDIESGERRALTEHSADLQADIERFAPVISGNVVVWLEYPLLSGSRHEPDIVAYNLSDGTTTVVAHGAWDKTGVRIDGSRIVWEDYRLGKINRDIYLFDLATGRDQVICNASGTQFEPKISGDRVVWDDHRNGTWDVCLYDLTTNTETVIASGSMEEEAVDISGSLVVWMEWPAAESGDSSGESSRLMLHDLSTDRTYEVLSDIPGMFGPAISGNRIIFMDLAHIPASERYVPRDVTVQEISLFTLDPAAFPTPAQSPAAMTDIPDTAAEDDTARPQVPARSPGPGLSGCLAALPVAYFTVMWRMKCR